MRKIISKEYLRRIRPILKSSLSPRNKIKAINQLAVPVFQYSCAILNWPQLEINNLDTNTRKLLTCHKMFYKNQCVPRLYSPRRGRRRFDGAVHRTSCVRVYSNVQLYPFCAVVNSKCAVVNYNIMQSYILHKS